MDKNKLSVITIALTPFHADGRLDEEGYRKHIRRLRDAGVSTFIGGSGSGEGYSLTPDEILRILAIAVEEYKGSDSSVYADGVESHTTKEMVNFLKLVEGKGAEAVRIMPLDTGHGSKPTPAELERYHRTGIEATSSEIILTTHQAAGYVLPFDLIERLSDKYSNVVGINYGGSDTTYLAELIRRMKGRIVVHCAGCVNSLVSLSLGGNGFMGSEGNVAPALMQSVIDAFKANDRPRLNENFGKVMALAGIIKRYGGSSLRGTKPLLMALGLPGGHLREPRMPLDAAEVDKFVKAVLDLNLPELPKKRVDR